ncbi:MAG TPA: CpaD family pilus assembly lipoprotein [Stellaceae bacterium]|nr:CpaD family pilus assembly lipoprotein [Stellaceae bacterium]
MRAFIAITSLLLVAGCVGTADPPRPVPEDPNPFTYKAVDYPFAVRFAVAAKTPSHEERARLQGFLRSASARPGDTVAVSSETTALGQIRSAQIRDILKNAGLAAVPGVDVDLNPNTVSLVLRETVAVPPTCGNWPIFAGDQPSNAPSLFLGCALKSDLYQMVVDKRDLAMGQTPGPADAEPGMRAVQAYREGKAPGKGKDGAADGGDNPAADSATGAATAAASMADTGNGSGSSGGSGNGQ